MSPPLVFSRSRLCHALILALFGLFCPATFMAGPPTPDGPGADTVSIETVWSVDRARPGDRFVLAVVLNVRQGFHISADSAQLTPIADYRPYPTRVTLAEVSPGLIGQTPVFPPAHPVRTRFTTATPMVFEGRVVVFLPMTADPDPSVHSSEMTARVQVAYQVCDRDSCWVPRRLDLEARLPVSSAGEAPRRIREDLFAGYHQALDTVSRRVTFTLFGWRFSLNPGSGWGMTVFLLTAGLGGLLLNFTPCVLPMIPIKIMSLSMASRSRGRCLSLGAAMSLGVIGFWLGLGATVAFVKEFTATSQLFQFPAFTILVGGVIGSMGLAMWRTLPFRLPAFVLRFNPSRDTLPGALGLGVLTAVLSTPCTAPFMGAAVAWAAAKPPPTTLATFCAIGTGMALPYLILSAMPFWVKKMPRVGPASVLVKQVMGLFMLAAAAYFVGSGLSGITTHAGRGHWWVVMGFCAAAGIWLAVRAPRVASRAGSRIGFLMIGGMLAAGSLLTGLRLTAKGPVDWIPYSDEALETARDRGQAVVMLFTAEWCLNCKALEQGVLNTAAVADILSRNGVCPIKVDITGHSPEAHRKLKDTGSLTIPLLLVCSPDGKEVWRSDFYTAEEVVKAVHCAMGRSADDHPDLFTAPPERP